MAAGSRGKLLTSTGRDLPAGPEGPAGAAFGCAWPGLSLSPRRVSAVLMRNLPKAEASAKPWAAAHQPGCLSLGLSRLLLQTSLPEAGVPSPACPNSKQHRAAGTRETARRPPGQAGFQGPPRSHGRPLPSNTQRREETARPQWNSLCHRSRPLARCRRPGLRPCSAARPCSPLPVQNHPAQAWGPAPAAGQSAPAGAHGGLGAASCLRVPFCHSPGRPLGRGLGRPGCRPL